MNLTRKLTGEFLGTATLLAIVVGSGIMGERLADGNAAIALLANSIATGTGLLSHIRISEYLGSSFQSGRYVNRNNPRKNGIDKKWDETIRPNEDSHDC